MPVRKSKNIVFRASPETIDKLSQLAENLKLNPSETVRYVIDTGLQASTSTEPDPELPTLPEEVKHARSPRK